MSVTEIAHAILLQYVNQEDQPTHRKFDVCTGSGQYTNHGYLNALIIYHFDMTSNYM